MLVADLYDTRPAALRQGARDVVADATAVASARDDGSRAASDAAGSVGGPLAAASHRLATSVTSAGGVLSSALEDAGRTFTSNARRYESDDATASQDLRSISFEVGPW